MFANDFRVPEIRVRAPIRSVPFHYGEMSASATNGTHYEQLHQGRTKMYKSKVDVVLGAQWGDEGKGKVVDMLASDVDIVCRCQVSRGHNRKVGKNQENRH